MHSIWVVPSLAAPRNSQLALLDERPRLCSADAGLRLSRAWRHGLDGTGEAAGGRLVTGREMKEGRRSVCAKPRGTRRGVSCWMSFTIGSTGNIEAIARGSGIMFRDRHGR